MHPAVNVCVLGGCPSGKALTRSGARPGDVIYVTGKRHGSVGKGGKGWESGKRLGKREKADHLTINRAFFEQMELI